MDQNNKTNKVVEYANFNLTFGKENLPMLNYFEEYIFQALSDTSLRRETHGRKPYYSFINVKVKKINGELVLVGNFVKESEHEVYSELHEHELVDTNKLVPTAPYSRFIIFLKNHRMILVKNQSTSPDIRSFKSTVDVVLYKFSQKENEIRRKNHKEDLPEVNINIIGIPIKSKVIEVLNELKRIRLVKIRMFPLNNDHSPSMLTQITEQVMRKMDSNTSNINFNNPHNKNGVSDVITDTKGMAAVTVKGEAEDGSKRTIRNEILDAKTSFETDKNIDENYDEFLFNHAISSGVEMPTSEENAKLYKKFINILEKLL